MMRQTTRRAWLAGASAGMLAAQRVTLPKKVRIGLIGLEGHSEVILRSLPQLPDAELVAVADPNPGELRGYPNTKRYTDYRQMLDREQLDVIGVCNSNAEREAAILACLGRKLHVAAEKPLALEMTGLERVKKAVAASGVHLTMLLPMRYDPMYLAIRQVVDSGEIGEVIQISSQKSYKLGQRPDWYKRRATYGGTIPWIGIHMIDLMRHCSKREFTEAFSMQARIGFPEIGEMENVTGTLFRLDNGGTATMHADFLRPGTAPTHGDDRLRLAGTKGVVEYQQSTGVTLLSSTRPPQVLTNLPPAGSLFVDFLRFVYGGQPATLTLSDIYRVTEIALLARDSAERRQNVRL